MCNKASAQEANACICLQISDLNDKLDGSSPTFFEPQQSTIGINLSSTVDETQAAKAPEKKLILFALRLAIIEKSASGIGTLGFIWATVVLLGGFAITLSKTDFWFITVILLIEGTRIFSRSHELEWQHQATWSITDVGISSFRALKSSSSFVVQTVKAVFQINNARGQISRIGDLAGEENWDEQRAPTRTSTSSEVPLLPYAKWVFISKNVSKLLYWLQLTSAMACVVLSLIKLVRRDFGEVEKGDSDKRNRESALFIFYSLALAEALLFLLEKAYWEWKVSFERLLESVNGECELGDSGLISIRRFFYDSYSRCVNGSIFDGLRMDMVTFGMELLGSGSPDEQLIGARILRRFSANPRFSDDTLQKIGINLPVMERLVEMLNWKDPQEAEIRYSAAEILSRLAGKTQNSFRITGIPGALQSISSLLHAQITDKKTITEYENHGSWHFGHIGLQILKKLARNHDICGNIGNTKGLLPKIVDFTQTDARLLAHSTPSQVATLKRSLQVLRMLAGTAGHAGKQLRKEISEIVFTLSNIRAILMYGEKQPELQMLGIEILTRLAIEEEATERIGATGGVIKVLFRIFLDDGIPENWGRVRASAGEALAMLSLESRSTCLRMVRAGALERVVRALQVPLLRVNGARILRHLCDYGGEDCVMELTGLAAAAAPVKVNEKLIGEKTSWRAEHCP